MYIFPIVHLRERLYQMSTYEWVRNLYNFTNIKNNIHNVLLAEAKILKKFFDDSWSSCLFEVIFLVYCPHCPPKTKIIVHVYLWINTQFIQAKYPEKIKAITRDKIDMEQQLKPVADITKAVLSWGFSCGGRKKVGRLPLSRILLYCSKKHETGTKGSLTWNCLKDANFAKWIQ